MSESANPLHPKNAGSSVEAVVIQREPALEFVGDSEAHWHDARTTKQMTPTNERPFGGVCVVERDTPVEIKGVVPEQSSTSKPQKGRWYINRETHETLAAAGGVYYLTVYAPKPSTPLLASRVVPAATITAVMAGHWYDSGRDRQVGQLTWSKIIDESRVQRGGHQ